MKKSFQFASVICLALCSASAQAALSYWDTNGSEPGAGGFGIPDGQWGTQPAYLSWSTSAAGDVETTPWTPGDTAVFSAGTDALFGYTATLQEDLTAEGIVAEDGNVTIANGLLTLTAGTIDVGDTATASIASTLGGTVGLTKTGTGTLYFINQAAHAYTSDGGTTTNTTINGGALSFGNGSLAGVAEADSLRGHRIINNGILIFDKNGTIPSFSGTISGTGSFVLQSGAGLSASLKLSTLYTNTYSGDTIVKAGRLQCGGSNFRVIPTGPGKGNVLVTTNAVLDLAGNHLQVNGLNASGNITNTGNSSGSVRTNTLTVGDNDQNSLISGRILSDSQRGLGLVKIGTGTLTLSGNNNYKMGTVIQAGTLLVNSSTGTGGVTNTGGTLGGTGTISGPVVIDAGGTLAPGASIGTLTINNSLAFSGNVTIEVDKSLSPAASNDLTSVSGTLSNGGTGTLTVVNLGPALAAGDTFQVFNKAVVNGNAMNVVSAGGGVNWNNNLATDGSISVASVVGGVTRPSITSILGAGTTSVTVNYANTIAGTNYVVQFRTNLNTTNWTSLSPVTAIGTTSSSTDAPPAGDPQRFYRVYYVNP